jgi:hypothetical protein
MLRKLSVISLLAVLGVGLASPLQASAYTFDQNRIIDDSVFNNFNSMSPGQIDAWLNGFNQSCISPNSGFQAVEPIGYTPNGGFQYGGYASAGQVIYDAAQVYSINPQVLLATLEKEQSLVTGRNNFAGYCNNGVQHKYAAATGYGCPDNIEPFSYSGLSLYRRNGTVIGDTGTTCVNSAAKAGFTQQVIRAAWLFKFGQQRSRGNISWAVIKGSWDNSDDPQSCYGGPMTQGTYQRCPSGGSAFYDGYMTIDNASVHIESGATAALYWYTPHFHGNQVFYDLYTQWFGSTKSVALQGCEEATNTTRSCIWYLASPTAQPYYTSSNAVRQSLVDNDNYAYLRKAFYGNGIQLAGNVPIYRLDKPGGGSFLTASLSEYNFLASNGFTGQGVDFYADPGETNTGYPVYRLYSTSTQMHRWVASIGERNDLVSQGYNYEGVAFTSISPVRQEVAPPAGQELVYRFGGMPGNKHFWTRDVYERDQMIRSSYRYEGAAWRAVQGTTAAPVYRLYSVSAKSHLFTADAHEMQVLNNGGWNYEGIAWYASPSTAGAPVYRLYSTRTFEHFFTTDAYERSVQVGNGSFLSEGTAWYQP